MSNTKYVRIGEIKYSQYGEEDLQAVALGSCVAVVIYDPVSKVAGMAHVALPDYHETPKNGNKRRFELLGRYAETGIPELVSKLQEMGAQAAHLKAKIAGGANIFGTKELLMGSVLNIGERNGKRIVEILKDSNIPIVSQDLGGDMARTVTYEIKTTRMIITNSEEVTRRIL